jgi:hypothetical protein
MALVDRLARIEPEPAEGYIANHAFSAGVYLWGQGIVTRAQIVAALALTPTDEVQFDQMKTHYDGLSTAKKDAFHGKLESLGILLETGYITKAFYKTQLGLA